MSPIKTYLFDLRTALGNRLPSELVEARVREARAHLLASADQVGETEAVRRYGRPRIVANGLVRTHRCYDSQSSWSLALPLAVSLTFVATLIVTIASGSIGQPHGPLMLVLARGYVVFFFLAFIVKVIQTRRWLAGPLLSAQAASVLLCLIVLELIHPAPLSAALGKDLLVALVRAGIVWLTLNAVALGLGRLLDLRPVHGARTVR